MSGKSALLLYVEFLTSLSMNWHHKQRMQGKLKSHNAVLISNICRLSFRLKWGSCNGVYPEHGGGGTKSPSDVRHDVLRAHDHSRWTQTSVCRWHERAADGCHPSSNTWIHKELNWSMPATLPIGYSYSAFALGALLEAVGNVWKHFTEETFHMFGIAIERIFSNWPPVIIQ